MAEEKLVTESREVSGFDEIHLEHFGDLTIEQTGQESLTIETDPDTMAKLRVRVKDGRLELGLGRDWFERITAGFMASGEKPIRYHVSVKSLKGVSIAGRGEIKVPSLDTGRLKLDTSGHCNANLWVTKRLAVTISGMGNVEYSGEPAVSQTISGVGTVKKV